MGWDFQLEVGPPDDVIAIIKNETTIGWIDKEMVNIAGES
jgi:hypothetical protein